MYLKKVFPAGSDAGRIVRRYLTARGDEREKGDLPVAEETREIGTAKPKQTKAYYDARGWSKSVQRTPARPTPGMDKKTKHNCYKLREEIRPKERGQRKVILTGVQRRERQGSRVGTGERTFKREALKPKN